MDARDAISTLVFTYAEWIDAGDFTRLDDLFADADFTSEGDDGSES
jgi:hypothetical protein